MEGEKKKYKMGKKMFSFKKVKIIVIKKKRNIYFSGDLNFTMIDMINKVRCKWN